VGHPVHFNYTPTVTYSGGTTNPTSITTDFKFAIRGKIAIINGKGALTRGSGDRTFTKFTLPVGAILSNGLSASITYATIKCGFTQLDADNDLITLEHSAMSSDGYYWIMVVCFI
jgi:hypothetical protein